MTRATRYGSWNIQDTHNVLNYKWFAPGFANAEQWSSSVGLKR